MAQGIGTMYSWAYDITSSPLRADLYEKSFSSALHPSLHASGASLLANFA